VIGVPGGQGMIVGRVVASAFFVFLQLLNLLLLLVWVPNLNDPVTRDYVDGQRFAEICGEGCRLPSEGPVMR